MTGRKAGKIGQLFSRCVWRKSLNSSSSLDISVAFFSRALTLHYYKHECINSLNTKCFTSKSEIAASLSSSDGPSCEMTAIFKIDLKFSSHCSKSCNHRDCKINTHVLKKLTSYILLESCVSSFSYNWLIFQFILA